MRVLSGTGLERGAAPRTALFPSGRREDFRAAVELALRDVLTALHVDDQFHVVAKQIEKAAWFRSLERTWERLDPAIRGKEWQALVERLVEISYANRPYCLRCGECCRGGSPSLHVEDLGLWSQGLLSPRELYTLRSGEPVYLNVEGHLGSLPEELVKIRQQSETGHCIFYQEEEKACRIYEHRPLQCRVQACWDPGPFEELWRAGKLSRRHLVQDDQEMLELIGAHDERCSAESLGAACGEWYESGREAAIRQILDQLRYDTALRSLVQERLGLGEGELAFYFGRPLNHIIRPYGFRVERDGDGIYHLVRDT
jgi:Fe-S-cluster containining protein